MSEKQVKMTKEEVYVQLVNFFEAYKSLTIQAEKALKNEDVELLTRLIDLRQQTIIKVNEYEKQYSWLMEADSAENQSDKIKSYQATINKLIKDSQEIEASFEKDSKSLYDDLKSRATKLAQGQKGIKAYSIQTNKQGRIFESRK